QLMKLRSALRGQFILELNELDLKEIQRTFDDDDEDDDTEEIGHDSSAALGATKKELSGAIRAATIDNFQGEEATVILASLVRSSTNVHGRGTIGFLKTPNRINVLLSRAKHGLILVGHGELLRAKSPLWQKPRMEAAYALVEEDYLVVDMRVQSYATWINRLTKLSTAHSHVHDYKRVAAMCVLVFAATRVADAKYWLAQLFFLVAILTETRDAEEFAMEQHPVPHASVSVTCSAASMGLVTIRAVILVLRALNDAVGVASTVENALYLVVLRAIDVYAIAGAQSRSHVATSVQASVGKTVLLKSFVIFVVMTT
ncbi:hypothetical protein PC123_g27506, partial [Phytophthora cactorum]